MKDLLKRLGRRVRDLRVAKGWSQEEFAHLGGLHRTYIGQIERGEKNLSLANLTKLSSVLDITVSDLLSELDQGGSSQNATSWSRRNSRSQDATHALFEVQKLVKRLDHQQLELTRTVELLRALVGNPSRPSNPARRPGKKVSE